MRTVPHSRRIACILTIALFAACADDPTSPPTADTGDPAEIALSPDSLHFSAVGDTIRLSAAVTDEDGNGIDDATIGWTSSDTAVATVDDNGLVTARDMGTAEIRAEAGAAASTVPAVVAPTPNSVAVSFEADTVTVGDTLQAQAEVYDANGNAVEGEDVTWSSSDASVATVDSTGQVAAVSQGEATITATAGEKTGDAVLVVEPNTATSVSAQKDASNSTSAKPSLQETVTLQTTGADGTVYTLTIPPKAVSDTSITITMTPITAIDDLPLDRFIAAVDLQPEGLRFKGADQSMLPKLTIELPEAPETVRGYGYHGNGSGFHLRPHSVNGTIITARLSGFSGYGVGEGDSSSCLGLGDPELPMDAALQQLECLNARTEEGDTTAADDRVQLFRDWHGDHVVPDLEAAASDATLLDDAVAQWFTWQHEVFEAEDFTELGTELEQAETAVGTAFDGNTANYDQLCIDEPELDAKFSRLLDLLFMHYFLVVTGNTDQTMEELEVAACGGVLYTPDEVLIVDGNRVPSSVTIAPGDTVQLAAEALDIWDAPIPQPIYADSGPTPPLTWASSDTTIITVDADGTVAGVAEGTAMLTVETTDSVSTSLRVDVTQDGAGGGSGSVAYVMVDPGSAQVDAVGDTTQFTATAYDDQNTPVDTADITWSSSDTTVATVDQTGLATAQAEGTAKVIATADGVDGSADFTVGTGGTGGGSVAYVIIDPDSAHVDAAGDTVQFSATAYDGQDNPVSDATFTWGSTDETIATVDQTGFATAQAEGTAYIRATADGVDGWAAFVVGTGDSGGGNTGGR